MSEQAEIPGGRTGPACYRNWRACREEAPIYSLAELPIYSDAKIRFSDGFSGEFGPYALDYASPAQQIDPLFILHIRSHLDPSNLPVEIKTDTANYTGVLFPDEIAALMSLSVGARFMAGGVTRSFAGGRWYIEGDRQRPVGFFGAENPIIPRSVEEKQFTLPLLARFPDLPAEAATALVRAARSYRDGLWIADREPELTWLLFVSALEVAAVHEQVAQTDSIELLRLSKPTLVQHLEAAGKPELVGVVARELNRELRATGRFLDFMDRFMPGPPEKRPPEGFRFEWTPQNLKKALKKVYEHRSLALHEGMPFPTPMCDPPHFQHAQWEAPGETMPGLGMISNGTPWARADLPMPLHTFEYIARGALLRWWDSLVSAAPERHTSADTPSSGRST